MSTGAYGRERGAALLEYLGLGVLAAVILGGLVTVGVPIGPAVDSVICRVTGGGDRCATDAGARRKAHDRYKPTTACTVGNASVSYSGSVTVLSVKIGGGITLLEERNSKGQITVTAVDSHELGVSGGVGAGIQWGKTINVGGDAGGGATGTYRNGDAWVFDNQKQVDEFGAAITDDVLGRAAQNSGVGLVNVGGFLYHHRPWRPKVPEPDITRHEVEANVSGDVSGGADVGGGTTYKKKAKGKHRTGKHRAGKAGKHRATGRGGSHRAKSSGRRSGGRKSSDADIAQGDVKVTIGQKETVEHNKRAHTYSFTVGVNVSGTANGDVAAHAYQPKNPVGQTRDGAIKVTTDEGGKVIGLDLAQTKTVNGQTTVTTSHLPVTDANRKGILTYLALNAQNVPAHLIVDDLAPVEKPGPNATYLQDEMYEHGQVTKLTYTSTSSSSPASVDVKAGLELGISGSVDTTSQKLTGAEYLGAPGADGTRAYKDWKECHR